jgi:hypothetical protein
LTLQTADKSLPGWTTKVVGVGNGIYMATLTDNSGRKSEYTDFDEGLAVTRALSGAFDIERQVSKNWNKFLYDFCLLTVNGQTITEQDYNHNAFGSWLVELNNKRIILDGKDFWLISQIKNGSEWVDKIIVKKNELTYSKFVDLVADIINTPIVDA